MIKVMKEMEQDEADERKGVPRAFLQNSQIIRFCPQSDGHKGRVIRHVLPKVDISVSQDDKKDLN